MGRIFTGQIPLLMPYQQCFEDIQLIIEKNNFKRLIEKADVNFKFVLVNYIVLFMTLAFVFIKKQVSSFYILIIYDRRQCFKNSFTFKFNNQNTNARSKRNTTERYLSCFQNLASQQLTASDSLQEQRTIRHA